MTEFQFRTVQKLLKYAEYEDRFSINMFLAKRDGKYMITKLNDYKSDYISTILAHCYTKERKIKEVIKYNALKLSRREIKALASLAISVKCYVFYNMLPFIYYKESMLSNMYDFNSYERFIEPSEIEEMKKKLTKIKIIK